MRGWAKGRGENEERERGRGVQKHNKKDEKEEMTRKKQKQLGPHVLRILSMRLSSVSLSTRWGRLDDDAEADTPPEGRIDAEKAAPPEEGPAEVGSEYETGFLMSCVGTSDRLLSTTFEVPRALAEAVGRLTVPLELEGRKVDADDAPVLLLLVAVEEEDAPPAGLLLTWRNFSMLKACWKFWLGLTLTTGLVGDSEDEGFELLAERDAPVDNCPDDDDESRRGDPLPGRSRSVRGVMVSACCCCCCCRGCLFSLLLAAGEAVLGLAGLLALLDAAEALPEGPGALPCDWPCACELGFLVVAAVGPAGPPLVPMSVLV